MSSSSESSLINRTAKQKQEGSVAREFEAVANTRSAMELQPIYPSIHGTGQKELKLEQPADGISKLPTEILDCVFNRLSLQDMVVSSLVQTSWKNNWTKIEDLRFDESFIKKVKDSGYDLDVIIHRLLLHSSGPVKLFYLEECQYVSNGYLANWIRLLRGNHLISLYIGGDRRQDTLVPACMVECTNLAHLTLKNCSIQHVNQFEGFCFLESLELTNVKMDQPLLQDFISMAPRLQILTLDNLSFDKPRQWVAVNAPTLKTLYVEQDESTWGVHVMVAFPDLAIAHIETILDFSGINLWSAKLNCFVTFFRQIQRLTLEGIALKPLGSGVVSVKVSNLLPELKAFDVIRGDIYSRHHMAGLFYIVGCAPKLQSLELHVDHARLYGEVYNGGPISEEPVETFYKSEMKSVISNSLRTVKFSFVFGQKSDYLFVKAVIKWCPEVKTIFISPDDELISDDEEIWLCKKILKLGAGATVKFRLQFEGRCRQLFNKRYNFWFWR